MTLSAIHRKRISRSSVRDNFASRESKTGELDVDRLGSIFREFPVNALRLSWKKEKNTKDFGVWRKHETQHFAVPSSWVMLSNKKFLYF